MTVEQKDKGAPFQTTVHDRLGFPVAGCDYDALLALARAKTRIAELEGVRDRYRKELGIIAGNRAGTAAYLSDLAHAVLEGEARK